jgi:3-oxoadipate CoA-transferase, beta subunit
MRGALSRDGMARRVAQDIPEGAYVNLGIGLPTKVSNFLPSDREIILHTENGMLGMGPVAAGDEIDFDLVNAGKIPVTELPGASYLTFRTSRAGYLVDYACCV